MLTQYSRNDNSCTGVVKVIMAHSSPTLAADIPVVILAGGQSSRLKVDDKPKWQLPFCPASTATAPVAQPPLNQTLLAFIISRLQKQTEHILINGPFTKYKGLDAYKLPLIDDHLPNFQGPLSGILAALTWAKHNDQPWIATVSCDSPFFPKDLLQGLVCGLNGGKAAIATYNTRTHPTFGLWSSTLYESLKDAVEVEHIRAVNRWALLYASGVEFAKPRNSHLATNEPIDPFFNINTIADYQQALDYLATTETAYP